jgi:hypothetical protein
MAGRESKKKSRLVRHEGYICQLSEYALKIFKSNNTKHY